MYNKQITEPNIGNQIIKQAILNGTPFLATKLGSVEKDVCVNHLSDQDWVGFVRSTAENNAGISPSSDEMLEFFAKRYLSSLQDADLVGIWYQNNENLVVNKFAPNAELSKLRCLEPFYHTDPWSSALKGKTVLVIHPFESTIKSQFEKREHLFKDKNILPNFELKTIKAVQTHAGGSAGNTLDWKQGLEKMIEDIDNVGDFDVAIIGCGAYGLPLGSYIKSLGKQAIHIGGGTQIIFGIKGKRWDGHDVISGFYNSYWTRPSDNEKPTNFKGVEGGCYW